MSFAGCSESGDNGETANTPVSADTEEPTDTPEPLISGSGIDGAEFYIVLSEERPDNLSEIKLLTPNDELSTDTSSGITRYTLDITDVRAGSWTIELLSNNSVVESETFEASFDITVNNIGTLSQLGVTGSSPETEHTSIQFTVTNDGDVPVSPGGRNGQPANIGITVPSLDKEVSVSSGYDDVVVGSGENIIPSGGQRTYRYEPSQEWPDQFLMFGDDDLENKLGQSFQGSITIGYAVEREDTVIPISVNLGDEMREMNPATYYAIDTTISKR